MRFSLEEVIEPYLLQQGLIQRTPRGRALASGGWKHLGLSRQANLTIYFTPLTSNISGISELTPEEVESYFTRKDGAFSFKQVGTTGRSRGIWLRQ